MAMRAKPRTICWALILSFGVSAAGIAQDQEAFTPEQVGAGAKVYATHCAACHGVRMLSPEAPDLRKFPSDQRARFIVTVANGKGSMPPWRDLLSSDEMADLWAYVMEGRRQ